MAPNHCYSQTLFQRLAPDYCLFKLNFSLLSTISEGLFANTIRCQSRDQLFLCPTLQAPTVQGPTVQGPTFQGPIARDQRVDWNHAIQFFLDLFLGKTSLSEILCLLHDPGLSIIMSFSSFSYLRTHLPSRDAKNRLPRPAERKASLAPPRSAEIDKTCGAQWGKGDCKFQG